MRPDPQTFLGSKLLTLGAILARFLIWALHRTCRYEIVAGREHLDALLSEPSPVILSFWHHQSVLSARFLLTALHRAGLDVTLLASQSRDGELVARLGRQFKLRIVRGSATRGGRQALRGVYRALVSEKSSPILIPDGPKGPELVFKPGVVVLAQISQAPILPLGFAARSSWRLRSWDRLIVPKPFTRIAVAVGAPRTVARDLGPEIFEDERGHLEALLSETTEIADRAVQAKTPEGRERPG